MRWPSIFSEKQTPPDPENSILFVGTWSYRKGCDLLAAAVETMPGRALIHAGSAGDIPKPRGVYSLGVVDQNRLPAVYHMAKVLALPSREDGFGVVISQALASGLWVVCSDHTGGPDIANLHPELACRIIIVRAGDVDHLAAALKDVVQRPYPIPLSEEARHALSWEAYAQRYSAALAPPA